MATPKLDRTRPFGDVYGHENARFYQDGFYFTGNETFIGKHPDEVPKVEKVEEPKDPDQTPAEKAYVERLKQAMRMDAKTVFEAAKKLAEADPDAAKKAGFTANSAATPEAKRANAEFVARNSE